MLRRSLAEIVLHHHRHHVVVLSELIYYFASLAGSRRRGHHQAERVLNAEVPYVRYLIGRIMKEYDYINRVDKYFRLAIYKDMYMLSPSRSYASPWIDLVCT